MDKNKVRDYLVGKIVSVENIQIGSVLCKSMGFKHAKDDQPRVITDGFISFDTTSECTVGYTMIAFTYCIIRTIDHDRNTFNYAVYFEFEGYTLETVITVIDKLQGLFGLKIINEEELNKIKEDMTNE